MTEKDLPRRIAPRAAAARNWDAHTVLFQLDIGAAIAKLRGSRFAQNRRTRWHGAGHDTQA